MLQHLEQDIDFNLDGTYYVKQIIAHILIKS